MNNKFETFILFIIILIIIYILYYSLYLANKKIEGLGRIKKGIDRGVKGARDLGERGYKAARDTAKQFDPSKLIKDVKNLSRDVGGAFKKIGDLERLLDKAFKQLKKIEEIPKQVVNVAREVDRFPKMINKLVKEIEKNIDVVDKVVDSLKDIVNVIEDEIKNAISKLEDAVKIAIDEIMKIKRGFLKFVKGVGNIFVQLFEIILKILYFIGDLPNCLIWYIIDAWDIFFSMDEAWAVAFDSARGLVLVTGLGSDSLAVVDVSTPSNPTLLGGVASSTYMNGARGVAFDSARGLVLVTGGGSDSLAVVAVSG